MNNKFLSILVVFGLTGCTAPSYNYTPQNYKSTPISFPQLGTINTIAIGEKMLEQGIVVEKDVLTVPNDLEITKYLIIKAGQYEKIGSNESVQSFSGNNSYLPNGGSILRRGNVDQLLNISFREDTKKICVTSPIGAPHCKVGVEAAVKKVQSASKDAFQQTLIYSGKVGDKINIDYREFSANTARPAFGTRVEYDLRDSKTIGYKGAVLEIIDANNQNITYKVVTNFN